MARLALPRSRGVRLALAAVMAVAWVPAWTAALGGGGDHHRRVPDTPYLGLGTLGDNRQLVLDVLTGRRLVLPATVPVLGHLPVTAQAQADLATKVANAAARRTPTRAPKQLSPFATAEPPRAATTQTTWDPKLSGARHSVFYPTAQNTTGPGTIATILGGRCDGLPGPQASVSPGNVVVDRAGRIFWVDVGSDLHAQTSPYIRTLDPDGRVRTLGALLGPAEGRYFRGYGNEATDIRLAPDQHGGVYFSVNEYYDDGHPAGPDWQAEDVPAGSPAIGHLYADGHSRFVAGTFDLYTANPATFTYGDGGPVADTTFRNIAAMTADAAGNLYVADSDIYPVDDASSSPPAIGQGTNGTGGTGHYGTDQPGYHATTAIRFLNLSTHAVTFYQGTDHARTVAAGTTATIAGSTPTTTAAVDLSAGTTPTPAPGDSPTDATAASIPFVAGLVAAPQGLTLLASSESYVGSGVGDAFTYQPGTSAVYLLGINTTGTDHTMLGTTVTPATAAVLGGGTPGYAGDGGPVKTAQFDVRDHDGWFYGDLQSDGRGGVLLADTYNDAVRDVTAQGIVHPVADGLSYPMGAARTKSGLVVADWGNSRILAATPGHLATVAGTGETAYCGTGTTASGDTTTPQDLAHAGLTRNRAFTTGADIGDAVDAVTDSRGRTYVAIPNYGVVLRVDPDGTVTRVAGLPRHCLPPPPIYLGLTLGCPPPTTGAGDGGRPDNAVLQDPEFLLLDQYDNLYISDGGAVRYINFGTTTMRPQGVTVRPGTIGTVFRHAVHRYHVPVSSPLGHCEDFCNTYLDSIAGLGAMTLDEQHGTLYVVDQLDEQVLAVNYCGQSYLVAGVPNSLVTSILGFTPGSGLADGKPAYDVALYPADLAYDKRRDLLLIADTGTVTASGGSTGRVLAVNVGSQDATVWGRPLVPRAIMTYAGGSPCYNNSFCSYGDGSHARDAAFSFPTGLALGHDGSVYVAEALDNRIRRVAADGMVGTVAGVSRNVYDGYANGSAAGSWWYLSGECGDGGLAGTACLAGLHSISIDRRDDLVLTDTLSGRVRRITAIDRTPLRADATPVRGAGWAFTPGIRLPNFGQEATDPTLAVDGNGAVYASAPLFPSSSLPIGLGIGTSVGGMLPAIKVPCAVWNYAVDADGQGHDAPTYLGEPDANYATGQFTRTCSIAMSPPGSTALAPPTGPADRLLFTSGTTFADMTTVADIAAGASRDGGRSFVTSAAAAVPTTAGTDMDVPWVVALDGDTSAMTFQDTGNDVLDYAVSHGGTEYAQLTRVLDAGVSDPWVGSRLSSQPVRAGRTVMVPAYPTSLTGCQRVGSDVALCDNAFGPSTTKVETVASSDDGASWPAPTALFTTPCRMGWVVFAYHAYCTGYHGAPQVAVDRSGVWYAVWDDGYHVYLVHSTDAGGTWSAPARVDRGVGAAGYPALVAGDKGRVAVAFYGSTAQLRDVATPDNQWWVYVAQVTGADTARPQVVQSLASSSAVHEGTLCQTIGDYCGAFHSDAGPAEAGNGLQVAMDPRSGRAIVAYTESRGVHDDGSSAGVVVSRQCTGPSLLAHPLTVPCSGSSPRADAATRVRCAPQGTDPTGDASYGGSEQANLDLTRLGLQVEGDNVVAAIDVSSYSPVPPLATTGATWTASWRDHGVRYFLQASSPTLSYTWGTVAGDGSYQAAGTASGQVAGNRLVMSVPALDVGEPAPGTHLTGLLAVTAASPPTGGPVTVDSLVATSGYDAGLRCPSIAAPAAVAVPVPTSRAATPAVSATPATTAIPVPVPSLSPQVLPPLGPPVIPSCGLSPPVPTPPVTVPPAPSQPHSHLFVVPPVVPVLRLDTGGPPQRGVAVPHPPPQAEAEAPQAASQLLNQPVGQGADQNESQPTLALASERHDVDDATQAAWLLGASTLTMAAGLAVRVRRRRQVAGAGI